jgi:hypothetical protein
MFYKCYYIYSLWNWLPWVRQGKMIFLNVYIFNMRGRTPTINQCFVCVVGAGEYRADNHKKSRVAAPHVLHQGSILI